MKMNYHLHIETFSTILYTVSIETVGLLSISFVEKLKWINAEFVLKSLVLNSGGKKQNCVGCYL